MLRRVCPMIAAVLTTSAEAADCAASAFVTNPACTLPASAAEVSARVEAANNALLALRAQVTAWANVRSFGAKGDGITDDTAAIQAAIDSLPLNWQSVGILAPKGFANGGDVLIPRGRYKVTGTIHLRRGVRIRGESRESSQLICFHTGSVFQYLDSGRYVPDEIAFQDLSIWQDPSVTAKSGAGIEVTLGPASVQAVSFQGSNLLIEGTYRGIVLSAGIGCALRDSFISKTVSHGFHVTYDVSDPRHTMTTSTTLQAVYCSQSRTGDGFRFEGVAYVSCLACASDSNFRHGYSFEVAQTIGLYSSGAEENGHSGVYLKDTEGAVLSVAVYNGNGPGTRHGVSLEGAANTTLIGSTFSATRTNGYGINVVASRGSVVSIGTNFLGSYASSKTNAKGEFLAIGESAGTSRFRSATGPVISVGSGSPEGMLSAPVGSLYTRDDGGRGTTLYVKERGSGNTGWVSK